MISDVAFFKKHVHISIEICNHQSSNLFNNFVILPLILNDKDKKSQKTTFLTPFPFVLISSMFTHNSPSSEEWESHPILIPKQNFTFVTKYLLLKSFFLYVWNAGLFQIFWVLKMILTYELGSFHNLQHQLLYCQ